MSRLPTPGADDNVWGQILNDYLTVSLNTDGTLKDGVVGTSKIVDGAVTAAKLSTTYIQQAQRGVANGVASLDASGLVPSSQLPASGSTPDATPTSKGVIQLAGDLGGTAASPTVPGLANKVDTSALGAAGGVATLDGTNHIPISELPGATGSAPGIIQLAGDLGGTSTSPTVPGLANKVNTSAVGAANGVASLDSTTHVPVAELPDATTSSKGIVELAGDLGGTAASPTVPGLANKVSTSTLGAANGVATLDATTHVTSSQLPDATSSTKGVLQLTGDLGGTAASPTVPGLANKVGTASVGVANGVASLDGTTHVPVTQLPAATATSEGIVQLAGDLGGTAASPTVPGLANKVSTSSLGIANGVATLDGNSRLTAGQARSTILPYSMSSTIYVKTGVIRLYNNSGFAWTIQGVGASVGTAPTGASIILDVKVSGTTIFTTTANRPTIAAGSNSSGFVTNMDVTTVPNGSYLTVDVVQIGSTFAGADLCVQVEVK